MSDHTAEQTVMVRLTPTEWGIVAALICTALALLNWVWEKAEGTEVPPGYRLPINSSEDYWQFRRLAHASSREILMVGDSVVWGEYVSPRESLTECLNREVATHQFVNAGVSGAHPLAIEGLMKYYAGGLQHRRLIVHCNLLWLSSPERDLSSSSSQQFNHPALIPQFLYDVPSYDESFEERLSVVVDRQWRTRCLAHHIRSDSFERLDIPTWSLDKPYVNPLTELSFEWPLPKDESRHDSRAWTHRGGRQVDFEWVDPDESRQLSAFVRLVRFLNRSNCDVIVVIGPLNEHMLTLESRSRYASVLVMVQQVLRMEKVTYIVPGVLPSESYGDVSHPLATGYEQLADWLLHDPIFMNWL